MRVRGTLDGRVLVRPGVDGRPFSNGFKGFKVFCFTKGSAEISDTDGTGIFASVVEKDIKEYMSGNMPYMECFGNYTCHPFVAGSGN